METSKDKLTVEDILERTTQVSSDILEVLQNHREQPILVQMTGSLSAIGGLGVQWLRGIEDEGARKGVALTLAKIMLKMASEFVAESGIVEEIPEVPDGE